MGYSVFFSLLFFIAFTIYLFFGLYIIYQHPKGNLNRVFMAVCISLCFWSFGFSMANSAPDLQACLFWRRVSAIGWGSMYSLLLHCALLLTGNNIPRNKRKLYSLLYLPAIISVYAFAISNKITASQYNLIKMDYGWINVAVQNNLTKFFNAYYLGYMLITLIIIWNWRRKSSEKTVHAQANLLIISFATALLLGSLTDVILSAGIKGPLPQMAPVFVLIPTGTIFFLMQKYHFMQHGTAGKDDLLLSDVTRSRLYYYIAFIFLGGGLISTLVLIVPNILRNVTIREIMLYTSGILFLFGFAVFIFQLTGSDKLKDGIVLIITLLSIPVVTLLFIRYASVTVWVFPILFIIVSLVYTSRRPLILITVTSVFTQLLIWVLVPEGQAQINEIDYIIRLSVFVISFIVGSFVNRTYTSKLRENTYQIDFQKLVSEISFDFITVNQENFAEKVDAMLEKTGLFFHVDRTYIFLMDHQSNTLTYTNEWCSDGIHFRDNVIRTIPADSLPWWVKQLRDKKLVCIDDTAGLTQEDFIEKGWSIQQDVKSTIMIPIEENEKFLGFMGLDSVTSTKEWSDYHVKLLEILSNLLADGLIKIEAEKEIEYLAYYDHLTNLPNRTLFSDRLTQAIHLALRNEWFIGVIFIDLDNFKMVNDTMGHSGGDQMIKEVAKALVGRVRKTDTVARFGGDEFLIMINGVPDIDNIEKIVHKIMGVFTEPFYVRGHEFFITCSAGVAVYPFDGDNADTLIKNADIAMYTAKTQGKNKYALCTVKIKEDVKRNIKLSNNLYRAQERGELFLHYQPQINLHSGRITGLEALLRWKHPEMGMIPPKVFIPLAEMNGTINKIGEWVLETAIHQNKQWQDMGLPRLRVAVNLSIIQFNNPNLVSIVDRILAKAGLDPQYLEFEITESIATKEGDFIVDFLNRFKQLGVSISIDDFGKEYSSLHRLKMLPIDRIKIDMQFIHGIESSVKDQIITKIIINLAKSLDLEVLAEGVETMQQLEFLHQKMCDEVQGYYYYKPMPVKEIEKLLKLV